MSAEILSQIEQAESYKQEGNARFKAQDFRKALGSYHKVFCYVNGLQMPGENSEASQYTQMMGKSNSGSAVPADKVEDVKKLKQSTHLNMAACYLKVGEHRKCIDACSKALAHSPISKAYFRRGQAHLELRNLDEAKEDFEEAQKLEPQDKAIEMELKKLKVAFSKHEAQERKRYANMFSKSSKADPPKPDEEKAEVKEDS
eukprot:TRINITY_DN78650_c0_g1_i1.p1 TRINITY_DN78650_c0_g1~~TRINITY_DN78650_c0_g1_i1.p1  ORF type:complete len:201 (+),score=62.99 TRINITY_DN78650_c0_g1_i1:153-755(+)